jgi:hypothetical protein
LNEGGTNSISNLSTIQKTPNNKQGGSIGNRAGKSAGAKKGHIARRKNKKNKSKAV